MAVKQINTRISNKHDLEVNWDKATFIPFKGELIIYDAEVDASGNVVIDAKTQKPALPEGRTTPYTYERFKIGDGMNIPSDLPFTADVEFNARINCGMADPDATTTGLFYFKYSE